MANTNSAPLVTTFTTQQVVVEVLQDLNESPFHKFVEMIDAAIRSTYGPQDETISSGIAEDILKGEGGFKGFLARTIDKALNVISPDHGEGALIADLVRTLVEQANLTPYLDTTTLATIFETLATHGYKFETYTNNSPMTFSQNNSNV